MTKINKPIDITVEELNRKKTVLKTHKESRDDFDNRTAHFTNGKDAMWAHKILNKYDRKIQKAELEIEYLEIQLMQKGEIK